MQSTIREEEVLALVNGLVLPRKSFDFVINGGQPVTLHKGLDDIVDALLNGREHKDNPDWVEAFDRWWAREHAAAMFAIGLLNGTYEDYLPGRHLMYRRLVDDGIRKVLPQIAGKSVIEVGSGSGISLTMLAREGAIAHGLDISETALGFFEYLAKLYDVKANIRTIRADYYRTDLPDNQFDLTYNVGVFEHRTPEERLRLLAEMKRITAPQGYMMISVPNLNSPYYKAMRKREESIFKRLKQLMYPERVFYDVDPRGLLSQGGLEVIKDGNVLLAPSAPIGTKTIRPEDYDFFMRLPQVNGKIRERIKAWELLEKSATPEQMNRYGWFTYAIGRKT